MSIQVITLQDFNPRSAKRVFRWSLAKTLLPTAIFTALALLGAAELFGLTDLTDMPTFPLLIPTLGFILFAWIAWAQSRAGVGKNALVAALDHQNLWVRVRSPLNRHIGSISDDRLIALPLADMAWSQVVGKQTITKFNNEPKTKYEQFLEVGFSKLATEDLERLLKEEREIRKGATQSSLHYPIQLASEGRVRLDLYNVAGGARALQKSLPERVEKRGERAEVTDLRS